MSNEISHYGTPRHSGRYPWGSGDDPEQRNKSFLGYVDKMKKQGLSEVDIAKGMGMTTSQLRAKKSIAKAEQRKADVAQALRLKDKGVSNVEIGKQMGVNESTVRSLLNPAIQQRSEMTDNTAKMLKDTVEKKGYVDVGIGVERHIGVSRTKLKTSIAQLQEEGYTVHYVTVNQLGTGNKTSIMVLAKPGVTYSEVFKNKDQIKPITDYSEDGGRSFLGLEPIRSVDSKRVHIRYHEDGGSEKDGVIELRRGVDDLSLGGAKYAQVRVGVDGTHYLKGMAMYSDDMPPGADIIYNTNKNKDVPKEKVFKTMKDDPDNPFGATVKQRHFITKEGTKIKDSSEMLSLKKQGMSYAQIAEKMNVNEDLVKKAVGLSSLNVVNEEGDWSKWSKTLSSQVLSKQTPALAKKQLGLAFDVKKEAFDEINSLTNPAIKKKLLESFADDCDSSSVHLKSAALPRQGSHVILPFTSMKETEIYAPNYLNGERVVLVRYPHGGIFEIPELTVNNKHPEANRIIGGAKDAVGINSKVAERLSGADFDGDTVLVIPNNNKLIKTSAPLKGLIGFDPKISYPAYDGMVPISPKTKQMKMGDVSNLITDMTIGGAVEDELARAVRHSMVVIDSEKHNLNYKQSYIDNNIAELKKKYQGSERSGASTLIAKASSEKRVGVRKEHVDPKTGKKTYEYTNETYIKTTKRKDGTIKETPMLRTISSTKMAEATDAFDLSSGTRMETVYATHANKLKALANDARKEAINTPPIRMSKDAKEKYAPEVATLNAKLNIALKNAPLERQAQILANTVVATKRAANPNMDAADLKKIKGQALAEARVRVNAKKEPVVITDREWEAIQAGAVSNNVLDKILNNTDLDKVKQLATPRTSKEMSDAKKERAKQMIAAGRTQAEVASALGVSTSTINKLMD